MAKTPLRGRIDAVVRALYEAAQPHGFRRRSFDLMRRTDGAWQVIHFQLWKGNTAEAGAFAAEIAVDWFSFAPGGMAAAACPHYATCDFRSTITPFTHRDVKSFEIGGDADVQPVAAGVREHVQDVDFFAFGQARRGESAMLLPVALPLRLDLRRVISRHNFLMEYWTVELCAAIGSQQTLRAIRGWS